MEPEKKSSGALIGSIIIIIILIAGGIYVWQAKVKSMPAEETLEGEVVSPSDEDDLNSLEMDVNSADTNIEANAINSVE